MRKVTEIGFLNQGALLFGQLRYGLTQFGAVLCHFKGGFLIRFGLWSPRQIFRIGAPRLAQRINPSVARDCENPCRNRRALGVKKMRLLPKRCHHILRTFLGQTRRGTRLHQKPFDARRKMSKQLRKGGAILMIPHSQQKRRKIVGFLSRHPRPAFHKCLQLRCSIKGCARHCIQKIKGLAIEHHEHDTQAPRPWITGAQNFMPSDPIAYPPRITVKRPKESPSMPFEMSPAPRLRIAVIGGGISGMAAAHLLADAHDVTLFEAEPRLGGHARTKIAGKRGDQPVDTGFIVFNNVNYPNLVALFDKLDVPVVKSDMSFGASINGGQIEYALRNLDAVFAQRRNIANPKFLRMLRDILRFNARGAEVAQNPNLTIGEFLRDLGTGDYFRDYYILPLSGAIWSTPVQGILDFPAQALVQFFQNHALMNTTNQHQWFTVQGGSVEYVRRLETRLTVQGVTLRLGAPIASVTRNAGALVRTVGAEAEQFDEVIFATHADDSLALLSDATLQEQRALGAVRYQPNQAVLHADINLMPKRRKVWSSWVYCQPAGPRADRIDLTYWMNNLQPIPQDDPLFVTLNATQPIREHLIHDVTTFRHPVYDLAAQSGRAAVAAMNGARGTWFCGAWMKNGFHEDGFASAVDVASAILARNPMMMAAE